MPMLRPFAFNLTEFGGKGDGVTENTKAFEKAIMEISSCGKKVVGNLMYHLGIGLRRRSILLNEELWPLMPPLPSYGVGREHAGPRYGSLIHGQHLKDVVITGLMHFFCTLANVFITNVTILAPVFGAPNTDGIDPDSCDNVVIEDCYISVGDDGIAIKSGWDQYGISYGRPSTNILIRNLVIRSTVSAGVSIGSEMSGGVSNVTVENVVVWSSRRAMRIKTAAGRGGYIQNITNQNITLDDVRAGFVVKTNYNQHPDAGYDPKAYPIISNINFINIHGQGVRVPVRLHGSRGIPLRNLTFRDFSCSFVQGRVIGSIFPAPCENLDLHDEQGNLIKRSAQNVTNIDYDY
ncbi:hypothetical protein MKW92_048183 [Papaver armeniacum]|nr:hypothetical protein MKW92_048183 [Papaver armeniacum]